MSINYQENSIIEGVLRHGPDIIENIVADLSSIEKYIETIDTEKLNYPIPLAEVNKDNWFMPEEYKNMDIEQYLMGICPEEHKQRMLNELQEFHKRNLISLLKQMKYIVDTLRKNNVIWGVGRGSSVASYVLYLIGVHKIDSIKYNLPIEEFFKEI